MEKVWKLYWVNEDELKEGRITDSWTVNRSSEWINGRIQNKDLEHRLSSVAVLEPACNNTVDSLQEICCFSKQKPKQRTDSNLETKLGPSNYMMARLCDLEDSNNDTKGLTNSDILDSLEELLTDKDMSKQDNLGKARDLVKELRKRI